MTKLTEVETENVDEPPRAARGDRYLFMAFGAAVVCLISANSVIWAGNDHDVIAESAREHRARARALPHAEFLRSSNDRVFGRVVAVDGRALAGVQVRVYDHADVLEACRASRGRAWPEPTPQAQAETDASGEFDVGGVPIGNKHVCFQRPGSASAIRIDVTHLTDIPTEVNQVLETGDAVEVTVGDVTGHAVLLPPVWGMEPLDVPITGDGKCEAPYGFVRDGHIELMLDEPPVLSACAVDEDGCAVVSLAPKRELRLRIPNASNGEIEVCMSAQGCGGFRAWTTRVELADGVGRVGAVRPGQWFTTVAHEGGLGWGVVSVEAGSDPVEVAIAVHPRRDVGVMLASPTGPLGASDLSGIVLWQPVPGPEVKSFPKAPRDWLQSFQYLAEVRPVGSDGRARFEGLPGGPCTFTAEGVAGLAPRRVAMAAVTGDLALRLAPAHQIRIEGPGPFARILTEGPHGRQHGLCDAFGEAFCFSGEGGFAAMAVLDQGGETHMRATSPGSEDAEDVLTLARWDRRRDGPLVFGFLTGCGPDSRYQVTAEPVTEDVVTRGSLVDENGFYSIPGLAAGEYELIVRREDGRTSGVARSPLRVALESDKVRRDFTLGSGRITLEARSETKLRLRNGDGRVICVAMLAAETQHEVADLPAGDYVVEAVATGAIQSHEVSLADGEHLHLMHRRDGFEQIPESEENR